jgi:hypothetical protein
MNQFNLDGHTLDFRYGNSGVDPWTTDYAWSMNVGLVNTCDVVPYLMVDGEEIYRVRSTEYLEMLERLTDGELPSWDSFKNFLNKFARKPFYFSTKKNEIDKIQGFKYSEKTIDKE